MATSRKIVLSPEDHGVFHWKGITKESAAKASEVLQENHDKHHITFNAGGFHNHIAHHILTIFALGASSETIQRQYENNASYQRKLPRPDNKTLQELDDPAEFKKYLGKNKHYPDYLAFFQDEIDKKGYKEVIYEYLFKGDGRAEDMLVRLHGGFVHPLIHLGFGIEFDQPAIIAEALAETAVHEAWLKPFLIGTEEAVKGNKPPKSKHLDELIDDVLASNKLCTAARWEDGNKLRDGILGRASEEMIEIASQWTVSPEELELKTAEMINVAAYFTGGAQNPNKIVKYDFYFMHSVNSSIFSSAFLEKSWMSDSDKVRLLEWKGRFDLAMFASRRAPKPMMDEITYYKPKEPSTGSDPWANLIERIKEHPDDGHAAKLVRALANGQRVCQKYEDQKGFRIKDKMWLQLGHMAVDSVENTGSRWVRSAGFEEAWADFDDRPKAQL